MVIERISSGSRFETLAAYSRALIEGEYIHISGTVGAHPDTGVMPESAIEQARNIFRIIEPLLLAHDSGLDMVVRNRVFLTDAAHLEDVCEILREKFGDHPPANTTLLVGIPAPGAKVEIEITARRKMS
ncbi:RidA family protein [Novosphingobium aquimarinum]|uniref:RidA family protein n=1 Tax=Novosphingobium aquimarinum TaxID=2682494 RepID=UPI0012EC28DE|nr:RidA family protein [Novosphingobium aquimarinum]